MKYGKMHYWGEMFEDVIDLKELFKGKVMKYISLCIAIVTIIYSLLWLLFNASYIVSEGTITTEVRASVYALLALVNAIIILMLLWSKK